MLITVELQCVTLMSGALILSKNPVNLSEFTGLFRIVSKFTARSFRFVPGRESALPVRERIIAGRMEGRRFPRPGVDRGIPFFIQAVFMRTPPFPGRFSRIPGNRGSRKCGQLRGRKPRFPASSSPASPASGILLSARSDAQADPRLLRNEVLFRNTLVR